MHIEGRKIDMTKEREEKKEKKKVYRKPELTGHGKLTNVVAIGPGSEFQQGN